MKIDEFNRQQGGVAIDLLIISMISNLLCSWKLALLFLSLNENLIICTHVTRARKVDSH